MPFPKRPSRRTGRFPTDKSWAGHLGGLTRARRLSSEARSAIARLGGLARQKKLKAATAA